MSTPTTSSSNGPSVSSVTINVPAGVTAGEILLLAVGVGSGAGIPNTPAGWNLITSGHDAAGASGAAKVGNIALFRRAVSSEPASYTISWPTATAYWQATMLRVAGADTVNPIRASAGQYTNTAYSTTDTLPTLAGTQSTDLVVGYWFVGDDASTNIASITPPPSPWATQLNWTYQIKGAVLSTAPGAVAAPTATTSSTQAIWAGATFSIASIASAASNNLRVGAVSSSVIYVGSQPATAAYLGTAPLLAAATRDSHLQPFASNSVWNTSVGSGAIYEAATDAKTASLTSSSVTRYINSAQFSVPLSPAAATDPVGTVTIPGAVFTHRIPANARIDPGTDQTMVVLDGQYGYEYWNTVKQTATAYTADYGTKVDVLGPGYDVDLAVPADDDGTRASRFSVLGGLIRKEELAANLIPHALVIALANAQLKTGYVWPATAQDANGSTTYAGQVPMGSLVAIPPGVDLAGLGLSPEGLALAKALQDYGAYAGDRAGQMVFYAEPECEGAALNRMRADLATIVPQLRVITNNTPSTVGGGGVRRQPAPPPPA